MKIARIRIYKTGLPYVGGGYAWDAGNITDTDAGLQGWCEITFATFASTPAEYLVNTTDLMNDNTRSTGIGGPMAKDGRLYATDTPGLGVTPDFENLGTPVAVYEA